MNNVAFIPARGGSKSIPHKNIKLFCGKPLIYYVIEAAKNSQNINKIFVSTDSPKIVNIASDCGATPVSRSKESSNDTAPTEMCMLEFVNNYEFDNILLLQATSPLTTSINIDEAFELYKNYDSILSVIEFNKFVWTKNGPINYNPMLRPRRQDMEQTYIENGSLYITSKDNLLNSKCRISGNIGLYTMGKEGYFDLDDNHDWEILEKISNYDNVIKYTQDPERINIYLGE